jgi:HAE1 family hydrophobic/amphiphilic exporter-1
MWLTRVFLQRPTLGFVFVALTLMAGFMALRSLVVQEQPNSGLPGITVTASYSGASTTDLQTEIAQPIEDQLAGTPYLQNIQTTIESGQVSIAASFSLQSTDSENIANVEKALQAAQKQLPTTVIPTLRVANPSEPTVVSLSLVSTKYNQGALGAIANNEIVPALEQLAGVSSVNVAGTTQPAFMVTVDPHLLAANNLTLTDVVGAISPNNLRAPGGYVYQPGRETELDVRGDLPDPQSVANLPIHVTYSGTTASTGTTSGGAGSGTTGASSSGASASAGGGASGGAGASGASSSTSGASTGAGGAVTTAGAGTASSGAVPRANVTAAPLNTQGYAAPLASAAPTAAATAGSASPANAFSSISGSTGSGSTTSGTAGSTGTAGTNASNGGSSTSGSTASGGTAGTSGASGSSAGTSGTSSTATRSATTSATGTSGTTAGGAFAAPGSGTSTASTGTTSGGSTGGTSTSSLVGQSAVPNVPIDTPQTSTTTTSTSASDSGTASNTAQPSVSSSAFGSGSGTSTSSFVGALQNWAVPSADKRVGDVATVTDSTVVPRISSSQNGKQGVSLLIQKQADASEVTVSNEVINQLPALRKQFPGIDFEVAHVQSTFTEEQVESVEHTLVEGIILTAVVMLFFLGSWRNAVVVMIAIPTSLGVTLFVMNALNLTLDTISLMAMTLVIGILIDDSTVVLENVERHHADGEAPADAALNGRSEIGQAAIVITMVDVVVFLPIAFAGGQVGQNLHEFAIVITIATLTSLFVSFTITPMLAGLWSMKSTWKPWPVIQWFDRRFNGLRDRYAQKWLPGAMARPWPIVIGAIVLCVLAYLLVPTGLVGEEYIPAEDQGIIYAQVAFPAGHPLAQTEKAMARLEAATRQSITPHDLQFEISIAGAYSAPFGGFVQEGNVGQISIYLNDDRKTSTYQYITDLQDRFRHVEPSAAVTIAAATQQGGGNQQQIDELVSTSGGGDPTPYAAKVLQVLKSTPGAAGVQSSSANAAPQMEVNFNRPALQALDVTTGTAAEAVEASFGGDIATQIETPLKGLTDIEVIYPRSEQQSLQDVLNVPVRAQNGDIVRLGDVATLQYQPAPLVITRQNRQQVVHVTANVAPGYELSNVVSDFQKRLRALHLGPSVTLRPAALGQQDLLGQALVSLLTSLALSIVLVFLMIVALYNSYRTPFVTLFAIPVATIGALGALWITHNTLNLYSLIGMVLLVGLVTKNGILLVDYADTVRERGKSREEGMQEAAATRFRPILMTTIAMIAGMLPLALGLEPGAQSRASLAIVVIGGLLSSLVLTLFIVPIMYHWIAPKQLKEPTKFNQPHTAPEPA